MRDAISLAYEVRGLSSPLSIRAHSTWSVASSQALFRGVSLEDICVVAEWSSPHCAYDTKCVGVHMISSFHVHMI